MKKHTIKILSLLIIILIMISINIVTLATDVEAPEQNSTGEEAIVEEVGVEEDDKETALEEPEDLQVQNYIIGMLLIFMVVILVVGGKKGLKAIISLIITLLAIYFILVRTTVNGYDSVLMTIVTSFIIILLTFIITAGLNKKVLTASLGTAGGVLISGILSILFGYISKLTVGQETAIMLDVQNITINLRELIFAGTVISSLGVCMNISMLIVSRLEEIKPKDAEADLKELFKNGMKIGRDAIGTITNTLILVYAGVAMSLMILYMACDMSIIQVVNQETMATDIISALSGSIGVILTIPITAYIYALINRNKTIYKRKSENVIEGKRSLKL